MNLPYTSCILIALTIFPVHAEETNACVAVYGPSVQKIDYDASEAATYNFVARNACSTSNRNITAGFDSQTTTLLNSVPAVSKMMGRLGASSNKQFCDAQTSISSSANASQSLLIEPLEYAYTNFNECMRILKSGRAEITHVVGSPRLVSIFIRLTDPDQRLEIQGVDTTGDFVCSTVNRGLFGSGDLSPGKPLILTRNETIKCSRKATKFPAGGFEYPAGVILVNTSVGTYTVRVPDETILGPATKREASRQLAAADEAIKRANAAAAEQAARADGVRVETKRFYFGAGGVFEGARAGKHYGCDYWTGRTTVPWDKQVIVDLCPNADTTSWDLVQTHSGGSCGYNYYTMACLYYPKPTAVAARE